MSDEAHAHHETPVLQAVANPPTLFFVPVAMAAMNIALQVAIWMIGFIAFELSPIVVVVTVAIGHIFLIGVYAKEVHIENIIKALGTYSSKRPNIVPTKAKAKYIP